MLKHLLSEKVNTGENESYGKEQRTRCSSYMIKGKCMGYTTYYVTCNLYKILFRCKLIYG